MEAGARAAAAPAAVVPIRTARTVARDLATLTKPKVQSLLLFTTITTMYVAGDPSPGLVAITCLGGALSAGGAGAINHYVDRDIDAVMTRTRTRPIPNHNATGAGSRPDGIGREAVRVITASMSRST